MYNEGHQQLREPQQAGGSRSAAPGTEEGSEVVVHQRYCHLYMEGELEGLCAQLHGVRIAPLLGESGEGVSKVRSNWQAVLLKDT